MLPSINSEAGSEILNFFFPKDQCNFDSRHLPVALSACYPYSLLRHMTPHLEREVVLDCEMLWMVR